MMLTELKPSSIHQTAWWMSPIISLAEEAGFQEGDVVVAIDGVAVGEYGGLIELRVLLSEEPGTEYTFAVERNGEAMELGLTLRDLYASSGE